MLRAITNIIITQVTPYLNSSGKTMPRSSVLNYSFCKEYEAEDSWEELTNKAKVTVPKNVYVRDANGQLVPLGGTNVNIGGFDNNVPLLLRGDQITITSGYRYFDSQKKEVTSTNQIFAGFISNVSSKKPIVIDCEDNMWKLKQIIVPNKVYPASQYTLESILQEMLQGTGFTVNVLTTTKFSVSMGNFRTQNETIAEVLARLRKDYHFESYFRGNELRCGSLVYIEQDAVNDGQKIFKFQQNIISDKLEYKRKDDINLSAIAYSINKNELNIQTKDGQTKTRKERLEVLVNVRNGQFVSSVKPAGSKADFAPSTAGERRTLYFWNVTSTQQLIDMATDELKKYYYTGMRGSFETFGLPYVRMGDNVDILDPVLPERNGRYKVKKVKYKGGFSGQRQEIHLDYLITALDANGNPVT